MMKDGAGFHPHKEWLCRGLFYTLVANPEYTLAESTLLFEYSDTGKALRSHMLRQVGNRDIHSFWRGVEERKGNLAYQYIEPVINKISPFVTNEALRLIVAQNKTTIPWSDYLDQEGNVLLISLPIGYPNSTQKTQNLSKSNPKLTLDPAQRGRPPRVYLELASLSTLDYLDMV